MDNVVGLKNARCVRRILARAKRRSRAFSKVSPSVFLSPFVVELVCDFCFARDSSSSKSPAWRYTKPVMPTFCREGECSSRRGGESEWRFFAPKSVSKTLCVRLVALFLLFLSFLVFRERCVCVLFHVACGYLLFRAKKCIEPPFDFNTPTKRRIKYSLKSLST